MTEPMTPVQILRFSMKRWIRIVAAIIVMGLLACLVTYVVLRSQSHKIYMREFENTIGVAFPEGISQVDIFDSLEYYMVMYAVFPDQGKTFLANFPDENLESVDYRIQSALTWSTLSNLNPESQVIPDDADLVYRYGESPDRTWEFVLDLNSGKIWLNVFYPDNAGDLFKRTGNSSEKGSDT